jgi:uncharacterized repeat protein (TIGR03943 family)
MRIAAGSVRVTVTAGWAAFFYVLWFTGTSDRYLGARTQWLVPFGAVTLTVAVVLAARSWRSATGLKAGEATGLFVLLIPLALALAVPHAELGAYAASRKSGSFFPAVKPRPPATPRDVNLLDLRISELDPLFAIVAHVHRGTRVGLLGIVTHTGPGHFSLTRFYITCCIADAQPLTIEVDSNHPVANNQWVFVTGKLQRPGKHYTVAADGVVARHTPSEPYLGFTPSW